MLPQLVLRFPCFLVKCGIRLEEAVDRVVEFEDRASGREISRPYGPISIERQVEFLPREKRLQFFHRLVRVNDEAVSVPKRHPREACIQRALFFRRYEVQVEEDLGARVLPQVLRNGVQRNALCRVVPLDDHFVRLQFGDGLRCALPRTGCVPIGEVVYRNVIALKEVASAGFVHELARDDRRVLLRPTDDGDLCAFILQRACQRRVVLRNAAFEFGAGSEADDVWHGLLTAKAQRRKGDATHSVLRASNS